MKVGQCVALAPRYPHGKYEVFLKKKSWKKNNNNNNNNNNNTKNNSIHPWVNPNKLI